MTPAKKQPQLPVTHSVATSSAGESAKSGRKPWIRRTPTDVVIDQIKKQEQRVATLQEELAKEKRGLEKLEAARKLLEST